MHNKDVGGGENTHKKSQNTHRRLKSETTKPHHTPNTRHHQSPNKKYFCVQQQVCQSINQSMATAAAKQLPEHILGSLEKRLTVIVVRYLFICAKFLDELALSIRQLAANVDNFDVRDRGTSVYAFVSQCAQWPRRSIYHSHSYTHNPFTSRPLYHNHMVQHIPQSHGAAHTTITITITWHISQSRTLARQP